MRNPIAQTAVWLGRQTFSDMDARNQQPDAPSLILFEPAQPVFTLGLRAQTPQGCVELQTTLRACADKSIAVLPVDRGGLGTFHAPGQIVVFVALPCERVQVRAVTQWLLGAAEKTAVELGHSAQAALDGDVGLWSNSSKLASIGLRWKDGIVRHGLALNVDVDPELTRDLVLCGRATTRLGNIHDRSADRPVSLPAVAATFCKNLGMIMAFAPAIELPFATGN